MRRIFVYEWVTGGGLLKRGDGPTNSSLVAEAAAMVRSLAADFACVPQIEAAVLLDDRLALEHDPQVQVHRIANAREHRRQFDALAAAADWTVVIAPEFDGVLLERCRRVIAIGGRLLGPSPAAIALASDKHATCEHLARAGIPVPRGIALPAGASLPRDFSYPAVLKPRFGAGSQGVCRVDCWPGAGSGQSIVSEPSRLEVFCPGEPASVAVLCGPGGQFFPLEPCRQRLSPDGRFQYLGGALPLSAEQAARARRLAERAVASLPQPLGYVGVDLILANHAANQCDAGDVVIEINPRLTTSYIGLRAAARDSLAAAMLAIAESEPPAASSGGFGVTFDSGDWEFDASGEVRPTNAKRSCGLNMDQVE